MEGEDLRQRTIDVLTSAVDSIIRAHCPSDFHEEWDLDGLLTEVRAYYPTQQSLDGLKELPNTDAVYEALVGEALEFYEKREQSMPAGPDSSPEETMRQLEREVMLQLIDQRWREHLSEMDYLREGINLRATLRDPLVEWQRDGFDMFGQMMSSIDDDYVKYVMHTQVQVMDRPEAQPSLAGAQYFAPEGPVLGSQAFASALAAGPAPGEEVVFASEDEAAVRNGGGTQAGSLGGPALAKAVPAAGSEFDRAGRNDPCPCGSGKKFKFCHGR